MAIKAETEIKHDLLGSIRYDDGVPTENYDTKPSAPKWVVRPDGWDTELEILIEGGIDGPGDSSLNKAVQVLSAQESIRRQAREEANQYVEIAWFDCTCSQVSVAFTDARDVYILWQATLDDDNRVLDMTEGNW